MSKVKIQYIIMLIFPIVGSLISGILQKEDGFGTGLTLIQIGLGLGFFLGLMTLLIRYLRFRQSYLVAIFIAVLFAILSSARMSAPISIFPLILLNLVYALVSMAMIHYIFYIKSLFRIRTLLFGIAGAIAFSLYLYAIYAMLSIPIPEDFWNPVLMYGLFLYVFMGFGMAMADLLLLRMEVAQLQDTEDSSDA